MILNINFETSNAAFEPDPAREVAWVLDHLAERVIDDDILVNQSGEYAVLDSNGNTIGTMEVF